MHPARPNTLRGYSSGSLNEEPCNPVTLTLQSYPKPSGHRYFVMRLKTDTGDPARGGCGWGTLAVLALLCGQSARSMYHTGAKEGRGVPMRHPLSKLCPEPAKPDITEKAMTYSYSDRSDGGGRPGRNTNEQAPKSRFIFCSQGPSPWREPCGPTPTLRRAAEFAAAPDARRSSR